MRHVPMQVRTSAPGVARSGNPAPAAAALLRSERSPRRCSCGGEIGPDGRCEKCRRREARLQRLAPGNANAPARVPGIVNEVLRSPGQPLDARTRDSMGARLGHDFSRVRIHTDARAADSARAVDALAYTVGQDVVFGDGRYAPQTRDGRRLLAHELAHTVQQSRPAAGAPAGADAAGEHDAERAADSVAAGRAYRPQAAAPVSIARQAASAPTAADAAPAREKPPLPARPGIRGFGNFHYKDFGRFDADVTPDMVPQPGGAGYSCKLQIRTRVKFNQVDQPHPWPKGRFASWKREFIAMVEKHWSTRYLLVPAAPCPNEGCTSAVVYVHVEDVATSPHHEVDVLYQKPGGARSNAGVPDQSVGRFYESDVRSSGLIHQQRTALHEAGHWFGMNHIFCDSNADFCYGITHGQSDDVMGRGEFVSSRDYAPFLEVMKRATGCEWRTAGEHGGSRAGSIALKLGLIGAIAGGFLGAALGLGLGALAFAGLAGLAGAAIGFLFDAT